MNAQKHEGDFPKESDDRRGTRSRTLICQRYDSLLTLSGTSIRKPGSADEESVLVERLKAGEQQAFETVFARYSPKLYRLALRIVDNVPDAEEVIQDVFWTVYRKAESFRGQSRFSTWLYRLTINAAV